jgi:hypothetical protein
LVYQVVEKAGNKGIWHKDIRSQTSLQQPVTRKGGREGGREGGRGETASLVLSLFQRSHLPPSLLPSLPQALGKILKNLEGRQLIKSTSSISSQFT